MLGDEDVDDLAVLVDGPVDVPPHSGDLDVGLVDEPPIPDGAPARTGRVDQLRSELLDPPVQGHMVHLDAALGEDLLQVPVGQSVPQVPADRQQDDVRRETEPHERRRSLNGWPRAAIAFHPDTLTQLGRSVNATVPRSGVTDRRACACCCTFNVNFW